MKRLDFYFKYAWRSILRGGQRSFFAVLCIAVGVAALVALQSLAASIKDTLTGDIQTRAGGDITARANLSTADGINLSAEGVEYLDRLKSGGQITGWTTLHTSNLQIKGYFSFPPTLYVIDPARFPLYGKVDLLEPAGGDFQRLLSEPNTIVLSRYLYEKNEYKLGQEIEVTGSAGPASSGRSVRLKIVGVVRTDVPGLVFDAGFIFGFAMTSQETAAGFVDPVGNGGSIQLYFKTAPETNNRAVVNQLEQASFSGSRSFGRGGLYNVRTAAEIQEQISRNLEYLQDLLSYVGLLAILIGGMGVINTMLVVIGRRTTEIATIKALGLKTRQTVTIFTVEALILGVLGSLTGLALGVALGFAIKGVAEGLFFRPLQWGLYPGPLVVGLLVGILTSGVFGFLPAFSAGRVRPGVVLRQQSTALPRLGGITTVVLVLLMTVALGLIGGVLLNNVGLGLIIAAVTLAIALALTLFMYLAVFVTGKLPAPFGPSFKMAMRSFSRHRGRTATTLLVMTIGLFFITFIVIIADSIKTSLREAFDINLGYNVVALNPLGGQTERLVSTFQQEVAGVQTIFAGNTVSANLVSINGQTPAGGDTPRSNSTRPGSPGPESANSIGLSGRSLTATGQSLSPNGRQQLLAGRNFTPADSQKRVLLVNQDEAQRYGVKLGDKIGLQISPPSFGPGANRQVTPGNTIEFEIIGIIAKGSSTVEFERGWVAPFRVINDNGGSFSILYMLVDRAQIKPALTKLQGQLLGGIVFDLGDLINTFNRLLDQVLAFPLLLSLLSLFSGGVLIANNVALAMLERRTEIGVLKAIGAKRRRVLNMLLWESGLVGLLGGLIGVGGGIVIALLLPLLTGTSRASNTIAITWSPLTAGLLLGLGIVLAVFATVISAWGAIQEKPLVVLRYE